MASMTRMAMSARSSARRARSVACCSVPRSVLDGRRRPAVSMKHTGPSGVSTTVSMASRVVPGMSCTMERSSPRSRLKRVDLPTLGRPMMATLGVPGATPSTPAPAGAAATRLVARRPRRAGPGSKAHHLVEQVAGPAAVQGAHREGIAQAERDELPRRRLPVGVVDLVDDEAHRRPGPPDHLGRRQVLLGDADGDVDHHEHDVGLGEGPLGLRRSPWPRGCRRRPATRRCP